MKILLLDIESAPNLVHVWGLWNQNIGLPQILDSGYVMCWAAKWYGEEEIHHMNLYTSATPKQMLKGIHDLLNQADAVVHYNGTKFDIPTLNKEFLLYGLKPPAPYKQIDLLRVARNEFKFPSNKLDYVAKALGVGEKIKHRGHQLWIDCMKGKEKAWAEMANYNINDVVILEKVYSKLKPWIKRHPNHNLFTDGDHVCPHCGSNHLQKRGYSYTISGKYQRYQCKDCGAWSRDVKKNESSHAIVGAE